MAQVMVLGSLASWKKYLDVAYPTKPADWDAELARIEAKLSEPGRMKVLQAMCKTSPTDAGAQLANVTCPVLVIEGSLDPDWADPRAEGEKIIADLPDRSRRAGRHRGRRSLPARPDARPGPRAGPAVPGQDADRVPRAGLTRASVTEAGAALVDEIGFDQLSMGLLAERLGVKTPSLYKHVASQADLAHRDRRPGHDRVRRRHPRRHPGPGRQRRPRRRGAGDADLRARAPRPVRRRQRRPADRARRPADPAIDRVIASWAAMLRGYHLDPDQEIHALRMLRSMLHGFATLEVAGGFQVDAPVDDSFTWMIDFIDQGLRSLQGPDKRPQRAAASTG